jgi:hypothetical protein
MRCGRCAAFSTLASTFVHTSDETYGEDYTLPGSLTENTIASAFAAMVTIPMQRAMSGLTH